MCHILRRFILESFERNVPSIVRIKKWFSLQHSKDSNLSKYINISDPDVLPAQNKTAYHDHGR